ncbi:MAG TPA: hypothetical protein DCG57_13240 [Candidatus Riflebacteria bacterium]|jgi:hypothetical protein|nr:hypothetical protein [Candidatus Riflebacteria bacterium]
MNEAIWMFHKANVLLGIVLFWGTLVFFAVSITIFPVITSHNRDFNPIIRLESRCRATLTGNGAFFSWLKDQREIAPGVGLSDPDRVTIPTSTLTGGEPQGAFQPLFERALQLNQRFFSADPLPPPYQDFHGFPLVPIVAPDELSRFFPSLSEERAAKIPTISFLGRDHTSFGMLHAVAEFSATQAGLRIRQLLAFLAGLLLTIIITIARYTKMTSEQFAKAGSRSSILFFVGFILLYNVFMPNITFRDRADSYVNIESERFIRMREDFRRYVDLLAKAGTLSPQEAQRNLDAIPAPPR